jgi:hypothetical protein
MAKTSEVLTDPRSICSLEAKSASRRTPILNALKRQYSKELRKYAFLTTRLTSGAVQILRKCFLRSGYSFMTQEDFRSALRDTSDASLINWLPMHITSFSVANDSIGIVFTRYDPLLIAYLRKMSFTIISWIGVNSDCDIIMSDAYDISNYLTCPLRVSGFKLSFKQASFVDAIAEDGRSGAGYLWRETILRWCSRNRLRYVGMGDEIEAVVHAMHVYTDDDNSQPGVINRIHFMMPGTILPTSIKFNPSSNPDVLVNEDKNTLIVFGDANKYLPHRGDLLVGLFSMSNTNNPKPREYLRTLSTKCSKVGAHFIVSYPFKNTNFKDESICIKGDIMIEQRHDRVFVDHMLRTNDILGLDVNLVHAGDLESVIGYDSSVRTLLRSKYYTTNRSNPMFRRYAFVTSRRMFEDVLQSWSNSQTQWARYVSVFLRQHLKLHEDSIYDLRFWTVKLLDPGATRPRDPHKRVTARLSSGRYVAVSGHLINLLLMSEIGVLDIPRYLRSVEVNIRLANGEPLSSITFDYIRFAVIIDDEEKRLAVVRRLNWTDVNDLPTPEEKQFLQNEVQNGNMPKVYAIFRTIIARYNLTNPLIVDHPDQLPPNWEYQVCSCNQPDGRRDEPLTNGVNLSSKVRYLGSKQYSSFGELIGLLESAKYHREVIQHPNINYLLDNAQLAEDNLKVNVRDLWHTYNEFYFAIATYYVMCRLFKFTFNSRLASFCMSKIHAWKLKYAIFSTNSTEVRQFLRHL